MHFKAWTRHGDSPSSLEIPTLDFSDSGLEEEREQYDITLKLFFLPGASTTGREAQTREAVRLVLQELRMPSADLLIACFPGIYFDEEESCPDKLSTRGPVEAEPEPLDRQIETWRSLEAMHDEGLVKKLGIAEFGHDRLESFLHHSRVKPSVDQVNLRDCCSVPKGLMALAKSQGVELLVHNDCSNILPRGTLRELLGPGPEGAHVLARESAAAGKEEDENKTSQQPKMSKLADDGIQGEVQPLWVVKYTAVVKNRGVVENKGYFAVAELNE